MYDIAYIKAFNDASDSYDTALNAVRYARVKSIGFGDRVVYDGTDKCAIHLRAEGVPGVGCGLVGVGSHPSIQAIYDDGGVAFCHAEDGCRMIDAEFARGVASLGDAFVRAALHGKPGFVKRYMRGSVVEWKRYGKGYCYLQLMDRRVRNRVARILGPFPIVDDVIRFAAVVGNWSDQGIRVQRVRSGVYHVDCCDWSPGCSMKEALAGLVLNRVQGIVGGDVGDVSFAQDGWFVECGYKPVMFSRSDVIKWGVNKQIDRADSIYHWLRTIGIMADAEFVEMLLIVTAGGVAIPPASGSLSRTRVKGWQILGDLLCKEHMLMHVLSGDDTPGVYAVAIEQRQSNKAMARALSENQLYDACSVEGLNRESKALANIVEGVIGVIGLMRQPVDVRKALINLGLVPRVVDGPKHVAIMDDPGVCDVVKLNSRQWQQVCDLISRDML